MTLRVSAEALSRIQETVSACAESVGSTSGEEEVTSSGSLAGAGLASSASAAASAVSDARGALSRRLTNHAEGTYDASRELYETDQQAADGARPS